MPDSLVIAFKGATLFGYVSYGRITCSQSPYCIALSAQNLYTCLHVPGAR